VALRVVIAGGGTGGHVVPGLAIARELRDNHGAEVSFMGTARGLETRLVPEAGFALELIASGPLKSVSLATRLRTLGALGSGVTQSARLLKTQKVDVVVGVGGYASGPAMLAARLKGIPCVVFEPNAMPGLANRIAGRWAKAAAVQFAEAAKYFRHAEVTGVPVRPEFFALEEGIEAGSHPRLLVFGGSQGARALNERVPQIAGELLELVAGLTLLHQSGTRNMEDTRAAYDEHGLLGRRVEVQEFLDDMPRHFGEASLILCRSGASTVAELAAAGKASVLVPFPRATDDHQRKNAEAFASARAAVVLLESEMSAERLLETLVELLRNPKRRTAMGKAAREQSHPDAARKVAEMVKRAAKIGQ
jgi:UDP-N-acetylglucosamine--N-acetylmuramyl-(pentapeptide) pyrophosphoryl-undecaprenol N-acetylglucosamine transferase